MAQPSGDLFKQAAAAATRNIEIQKRIRRPDGSLHSEPPPDEPGLGDASGLDAIAGGALKAGFETKDFIVGEPAEEDKSQFRRSVEETVKLRQQQSTFDGITSNVTQFVVGLIGAGKLIKPIKMLQGGGKAVKAAVEVGKAASVGAIAFDPHEERLSNLIESFPALQNPVSEYLAANPDDSAAEGRFKAALESIGLDVALIGAFALGARSIKLGRAGDQEGAKAALGQMERAEKKSALLNNAGEGGFDAISPKFDPNGRLVEEPGAVMDADEVPGAAAAETPNVQTSDTLSNTEAKAGDAGAGEVPTGDALPGGRSADNNAANADPSGGTSSPAEQLRTPGRGPKKPEPVASRVDVADEDITTILKSTEDDIAAVQRWGSREAAIEAGHQFSGVNLPWQKLRGTTEVRAFVDNAAAALRTQLDARKGGNILTDRKVREMVSQRARIFNEDPDIEIGKLVKAGDSANEMVANMEASYLIAQKMFQDAYDVAFKLRNGVVENTPEMLEELRARIMAASDLVAAARSLSSNSGRALRRMRTMFQVKPEDVAALKSLDGEKLMELVYATKGDTKKLAQLSNPSFIKRALDAGMFSLTNSLLWMYPTHAVNLTTNLYMLVARPGEKFIGSLFMGSKGSATRSRALKEYYYTVASLADGWDAAVESFIRGDSVLHPHGDEYFEGGGAVGSSGSNSLRSWRPVNSIWDMTHNAMMSTKAAIGLPTRALGAVDEFIKTLRYRAVVQARAAVEADQMGLSGADLKEYMEKRLGESFDEAGRAVDAEALKEAQTSTFQQELIPGTLGAATRNFRHNWPYAGFILPFVKTPVNVLRYSVKMTPGLNLLQTEYRHNILGRNGAEAQAQAVGQMTLGAMFMGIAATMAANGRITGGGPSDLKLKAEMMAHGWKPYSIVWEGADGKKRYFPIGRFDPVGMPFSLVADLVDMQINHPNTKEASKGLTAVAVALAQNFGEKTFLLNLNQAVRAMSDPGTYLEKYAGQTAGNVIPFSSLFRGLNPDPYMRDARGFVDNMLKGVPGYSETLPPTRDVFGEPVMRRVGITSTSDEDVVEAEHNRIISETGYGIGPPSPNRNGVDIRDLTLEDGRNAYDRLQELAAKPSPKQPSLKQALAKLIRHKNYQDMPEGDASTPGTKLWAFSGVVSKYREAAFKSLMAKSPKLREEMFRRQKDARAAYLSKKSDGRKPSEAEQLLQQMGLR